jgi:hypothetical protein
LIHLSSPFVLDRGDIWEGGLDGFGPLLQVFKSGRLKEGVITQPLAPNEMPQRSGRGRGKPQDAAPAAEAAQKRTEGREARGGRGRGQRGNIGIVKRRVVVTTTSGNQAASGNGQAAPPAGPHPPQNLDLTDLTLDLAIQLTIYIATNHPTRCNKPTASTSSCCSSG